MNKVMEAAIQGHHARGSGVTGPPVPEAPRTEFDPGFTATGYEPGSQVLLRDEKTKYEVQADGSFRKMTGGQAEGEFNQVLRSSIGRNKKKR